MSENIITISRISWILDKTVVMEKVRNQGCSMMHVHPQSADSVDALSAKRVI
jgi:hypothetical protein